jgi:SAM-dependent methyltransferase/uncharacterized protein YbaR (Trm112 family)
MRTSALEHLRCPSCQESVVLDYSSVTPLTVETEFGDEIREAFLSCESCNTTYPVLAGVAILLPDPLAYVAIHASTILQLTLPYLSDNMLRRLLQICGENILESHLHEPWSGSMAGMRKYLLAHYDSLSDVISQDHPVRPLVHNGDWYQDLLDLAADHIRANSFALDIGCGVGGVVYRLAKSSKMAYGVDCAFAPIFTARRILLRQPSPQDNYSLRVEGVENRERTIRIALQGNVECVVGSSQALPFAGQFFDVVSAFNVLDVVPSPRETLIQIRNMLNKHGVLVTTDPYNWDVSPAPIEEWTGGKNGETSADGMRQLLKSLFFRILEDRDMIPLLLREHQRHYKLFLNHHIVATKDEVAREIASIVETHLHSKQSI